MTRWTRGILTALSLVLFLGVVSLALHAAADQKDDLAAMVVDAKTAADHEAIAKKYDALSAEEKSRAAMHTKMAQGYKSMGGAAVGKYHMDHHCESIAKSANATASEYEQMANAHREMAAQAK